MSRDEQGEALEREFADVLGVLRRFEVVGPPPGLEERVAMKLKDPKNAPPEPAPPVREVAGVSLRCAFCRGGLERPESVYCASCLAPHHAQCFREHGRCSAPGCEETAVVRPRPGAEPTRRARGPRRRGLGPLLVAASALLTAGLGVLLYQRVSTPIAVRDEQVRYAEFRRAWSEGELAFREFNRAGKAGDAALERRRFEEARAKLTRAMDLLEEVLAPHRDHDGRLPREYEGHEADLQAVATLLVDLGRREPTLPYTTSVTTRPGSHEEVSPPTSATRTRPSLAEQLLEEARACLARGDREGALVALTRSIELEPANPATYVLRGDVCRETGRFAEALEQFSRALMLDPRSTDAYVGRGRVRVATDDTAGAIADFERALELAPDHPSAGVIANTLKELRRERRAQR